MKLALLADTHAGARNDSQVFTNYCLGFLRDVFIPKLLSENIKTIIHCGDVFDRRKYINFKTLSDWKTNFFDVLQLHNIQMHIIVGNHDVYYKNTNDVNSMQLLESYDNIHIYEEPTVCPFDENIVFCPWIPTGMEKEFLMSLDRSTSKICFGHFELVGFDMFKGHEATHGLDSSVLQKFDHVFSGHYHHKSTKKNITYLGSPYPMIWSDYKDARGFHIFDTKSYQLDFISNEKSLFIRHEYNDEHLKFDDLLHFDFGVFTDCYVKIIVECKNNPYLFDKFLEELYHSSPIDVSVVDLSIESQAEEIEVDLSKDTRTLLVDYIKDLNLQEESKVIDFMIDLYNESLMSKNQEGT